MIALLAFACSLRRTVSEQTKGVDGSIYTHNLAEYLSPDMLSGN